MTIPASLIAPAAPIFTGRLWVLVGAANSSATFEFAQTVRQNGLGKLVGQSTGGNQQGINGGAFFFLRLPNSGIELDLPLIGQFPAEAKPDAGLEPDILVTPPPATWPRAATSKWRRCAPPSPRSARRAESSCRPLPRGSRPEAGHGPRGLATFSGRSRGSSLARRLLC